MTDTPATSPITSIKTILSGFRSSTFRGTLDATASMISFEETRLRRFSSEPLNVSSTPICPARLTTAAPILGMSQRTTSYTGFTLRMYLNCQGRYLRIGRRNRDLPEHRKFTSENSKNGRFSGERSRTPIKDQIYPSSQFSEYIPRRSQ